MFLIAKNTAVDKREFARFVLTGVTATAGNIAVVYLAGLFVSFEIALLAGIVAAVVLSFTLSKLFAFGSRSWEGAGGEAARFLIVYTVSCAVYWGVAVVCTRIVLVRGMAPQAAEIGGILIGAGTMMLTSYFGHRFFTYRTYRRTDEDLGRAS